MTYGYAYIYTHMSYVYAYIYIYIYIHTQVASESAAEFEKLWEAGKNLKGWTRTGPTASLISTATGTKKDGRTLDLSMYYSAEDLKPLGMDRLKEALEVV
jgi:Replication stress response SDE2 C-terminal